MSFRPGLILLLLLLAGIPSLATHIVGGNIHYEHLGNGEYLIQLYVYRDCASSLTDFDDPAAIGAFDSNGNLIQNIEVSLSDAVVSDVPINTWNPCLSPPEGICVKEAIYTATVTLPQIPGGYTLAYQRCCRNTTLVNCESNDDLGSTFYAEIPGSDVTMDNSNPSFNEYPPVVICLNQAFVFDHSATDLDGDQIVYEFCNPLLTNEPGFYINPPGPPPYPELQFYPEYSFDYPIDSDPAFAIDANTGLVTGTPTALGQYVVGVCLKEYRDGELIATMNRDFQFNVVLCEVDVIASIPDQEVACDGLTIEFLNNSINAEWYFWDFGVEGIDSDTSNVESPTFTFPDFGEYTITLIANPGLTCADTAWTTYTAAPEVSPDLLPPVYECINDESTWSFAFEGELADGSEIYWDFGPQASPASSTQQVTGPVNFSSGMGDAVVTLTITLEECEQTQELIVNIPAEPIAAIEPQEAFCNGFTYTFGNISQNATDYLWDFDWSSTDEDESQDFEPETTFPEEGEYEIELIATAEHTCPNSTSLIFEIFGDLNPFFEQPEPECLVGNSFEFNAEGAATANATYLWEFELANIAQSTDQNVSGVNYGSAGWFEVLLTITENGCEESYLDSVWVLEAPQLGMDVQFAEGCPPLTVHFEDLSTYNAPLQYLWNFGDGTSSIEADPTHVYPYSGMYDVTLTITSVLGCITSLTQTIPDAVFVYPVPLANFDTAPVEVELIDPTVTVTDLSEGSIDCWYNMSDGGVLDNCNGSYDWTEPGYQIIVQHVINEYGCRDSIGQLITVSGYTLYAPNSFTPDGDGLNEVWMPVMTGVMTYKLNIYNRWGEIVFATQNLDEPWLGNVQGGDHYAQDGIYTFQIVIEDFLSNPHVFVGHISLLR